MREKVIEYLRNSDWESLTDVRDGDIIPCIIDGEMVEGLVHASPKDVGVMLKGRGLTLKASSHIMMMAPKIYTEEPWKGARLNEYGVQRVKELLVGLYHDYRIITSRKEQLCALLPEFVPERRRYSYEMHQKDIRTASLKESFKAGEISQQEYMLELRRTREWEQEEATRLDRRFQDIFGALLSDCVNCDNLMDIIENLSVGH